MIDLYAAGTSNGMRARIAVGVRVIALEWFQSSTGRAWRNCGIELEIRCDASHGFAKGG